MSDGLEDLLRKHQSVLQSEGGFACWECGDVKDPGAHQAEALRDAGLVGEVEYSVRFDNNGYVETRHVCRESAEWSLEQLTRKGVSATLVTRIGPTEWRQA